MIFPLLILLIEKIAAKVVVSFIITTLSCVECTP